MAHRGLSSTTTAAIIAVWTTGSWRWAGCGRPWGPTWTTSTRQCPDDGSHVSMTSGASPPRGAAGGAEQHPWVPDVLGGRYAALTLDLGADDEGPVVATLVRLGPSAAASGDSTVPARVVLYLHGWSDYFFQTGLAEHWDAEGAAFYALDLRKFGRSLREHQTPGYITDFTDYDVDLDAALAVIRSEWGEEVRVVLVGFSQGGLIASLWAHRHPGAVSALVLNSPWLELQGSSLLRHLAAPSLRQLSLHHPRSMLPNVDPGWNARTISAAREGEWDYDTTWHPTPSFPVRVGWLRAVMAGHAALAHGLAIDVPVLVALSARSVVTPWWQEAMRSADVVIDVNLVALRAVRLGPCVTVLRIDGGLHDLTLSPRPVRDRFYDGLTRWSGAYAGG